MVGLLASTIRGRALASFVELDKFDLGETDLVSDLVQRVQLSVDELGGLAELGSILLTEGVDDQDVSSSGSESFEGVYERILAEHVGREDHCHEVEDKAGVLLKNGSELFLGDFL